MIKSKVYKYVLIIGIQIAIYIVYKHLCFLLDKDLNNLLKFYLLRKEYSVEKYNEFIANYALTSAKASVYNLLFILIFFGLIFLITKTNRIVVGCLTFIVSILLSRIDYFEMIDPKLPTIINVKYFAAGHISQFLVLNMVFFGLIAMGLYIINRRYFDKTVKIANDKSMALRETIK